VAQSNDYVEDVPLGEQTHLNTTEFKYYGFYHRIKQKLEQHWGASLQEKMERIYKSGRQVASIDNRITSLVVKLDEKGNIVEVQISSTSGVRELDDAAIESFNKAGPFPNPPKGMMENGVARIEWGFVVKG
jgi:protein TonB